MPRLRALTSSSVRKVGEEFDASDIMARLLCAPDALGGQVAEYVDRAMRADEPAPKETKPDEPRQISTNPEKRRYMRRDLRAQE